LLGFEICAFGSFGTREQLMEKVEKYFSFDDVPKIQEEPKQNEDNDAYYISSESEDEDEKEEQ